MATAAIVNSCVIFLAIYDKKIAHLKDTVLIFDMVVAETDPLFIHLALTDCARSASKC